MLIRLFSLIALILASIHGSALAQDAEAAPEAAAEALEAQSDEPEEPQAPAFDPEPFLNAMVSLRSMGQTCDPFVGNDAAQRTQGVVGYFEALGQTLPPDLADQETQASLARFIGSQAAMLCQSMLDNAFARFQFEATQYEANRPEEWPAAPAANPASWCQVDYCLDR